MDDEWFKMLKACTTGMQELEAVLGRQGELIELVVDAMDSSGSWVLWVPQMALVVIGLATLVFVHLDNRRNQFMPYIKMLDDELNDIILSLYNLFENPQWSMGGNEAWEANYRNNREGFLAGNRYFVRSSIKLERSGIEALVRNSGRRKMYFNELKKRYVVIYEALQKATQCNASTKPMYAYFEITEYKKIYDAYKGMEDIK